MGVCASLLSPGSPIPGAVGQITTVAAGYWFMLSDALQKTKGQGDSQQEAILTKLGDSERRLSNQKNKRLRLHAPSSRSFQMWPSSQRSQKCCWPSAFCTMPRLTALCTSLELPVHSGDEHTAAKHTRPPGTHAFWTLSHQLRHSKLAGGGAKRHGALQLISKPNCLSKNGHNANREKIKMPHGS